MLRTNTLVADEQSELVQLETVIEHGRETFIEVGLALCRIRDARLYRATHGSFSCYCEERWSFSRVQAHRLIEAANVVQQLPIGNSGAITNEAQARALARVPKKQRVEVLSRIQKSGGNITARKIREAVLPAATVATKVIPKAAAGHDDEFANRLKAIVNGACENAPYKELEKILTHVNRIPSRVQQAVHLEEIKSLWMLLDAIHKKQFLKFTCEVTT